MGEVLVGLLLKVAESALGSLNESLKDYLSNESPITRAINLTAQGFPELEGVGETLKCWCESSQFENAVNRLLAGERGITDQDITQQFISTTGFYCANETDAKALLIIERFFRTIEMICLSSSGGLLFHATRQEVLHAKAQDSLDEISRKISSLSSQFAGAAPGKGLIPSDNLEATQDFHEQVLHGKVDQARDLLKDGKPITARSILEKLRIELSAASPTNELLFRIATNLGVCALHLDQNQTAIIEFEEALRLQPQSAKAIANAGIAALIKGDLEQAEALSIKALSMDARQVDATTVLIQALHGRSKKDELAALLQREEWISNDAACCWVLGDIAFQQNAYEEAAALLQKSAKMGTRNPNLLMLLGKVIVDPALNALRKDPPLVGRLPHDSSEKLKQGEELLDEAITALSGQENKARLLDALASRAGVRCALGNMHQALRDCNRVLGENENHSAALQNKAIILLSLGKLDEAIPCIEAIKCDGTDQHLLIILASAYSETGAYEKALSLVERMWRPHQRSTEQLEIANILLRAYSKLGRVSRVAEVLRELSENWGDDPESLLIRARHARIENRSDDALVLLDKALTLSVGPARERVAIELSQIHFSSENYAEAAKILDGVIDKTHDSPLTRKYVVSLYNSHQLREAINSARLIRAREGVKPVISEIEALVLESTGDLKGSHELWTQLSSGFPGDVKFQIALARVEFRSGNRASASQRLSKIQPDEIKDNAEALMEVAQLSVQLDLPGVLPLLYRAREIDIGNPSVHLAYLALFFGQRDVEESLHSPDIVGPECVVHLKRGNDVRTFAVLENPPQNRRSNELGLTDSLAMKLLGRRKSDQVVVKDTELERLSYEIVDIQSKYVYAFQRSIEEFTTLFPSHPGLSRLEFKENDFSPLFVAIDKRYQFVTQLTRLYQDKGIPLSTIAKLAGSRLTDVWSGMMIWQDGRIITTFGSLVERQKAENALASSKEVVMDLISLLTIGQLGLLERLPKRFKRIFIPQAVLDELNLTLAGNVLGGRPSGTFGKLGDQYFHKEITADELARGEAFLKEIRSFVENSSETIPTASILDMDQPQVESLRQILPDCALAALLCAKEKSAILYSDDLGLRQIGDKEWQLPGVWTQVLLTDLSGRGLITVDEYRRAVRDLVLHNYFFVSVTHDDLLHYLKLNNWNISPETVKVFNTLRAPDCDEQSAIRLVANLLRSVWLEPLMDSERHLILDLALNSLIANRFSLRVTSKLKVALRQVFELLPLQLNEVYQIMSLWQRTRTAASGLVF